MLYPQELVDEAIEEYKKNPNIEDIEEVKVEEKKETETKQEKIAEEKPVAKPGGKLIYN